MAHSGRVGSNPTWSTTCRRGATWYDATDSGSVALRGRVSSNLTVGILTGGEVNRIVGYLAAFFFGFIVGSVMMVKKQSDEESEQSTHHYTRHE